MFNKYLIILFLMTLVGCAGNPPNLEYNLAKRAISAAKEHSAKKFASGLWYRANKSYQKGQDYYNSREYGKASENFDKAISAAEKAEIRARIKKQKRGEVF